MKKVGSILIWLVGIILLLVVAAVIILPMVVDPNDYKELIVSKAKEQTGRDLKIDEPLNLSVFPWVGLEAGGIELGNADGFGDTPFARIEHVAVRVKLWPLLSKEIKVGQVTLDGLQLNLARDSNGRGNWEDLASEGAETAEPDEQHGGGPGGPADFSVEGLKVSSGSLSWDDRQAGQKVRVDQIRVTTGAIEVGAPIEFDLGFSVTNDKPPAKGTLGLSGTVTLALADEQIQLENLLFKANLEQQENRVDLTLNSGMTFDGKADRLQLQPLHAEAEITSAATTKPLNLTLDADVTLQPAAGTLKIPTLTLDAGGPRITGALSATDLNSAPRLDATLALAPFNARQWMEQHGLALPPMADGTTLTNIAAELKIAGSLPSAGSNEAQTIRIEPLSLTLDQTALTGSLLLKDTRPLFALVVDQIDLDRYLPPEEAPTAETAESSAPNEALIPVETLRQLDLKGSLTVGQLKIKNLKAAKSRVEVEATGGVLTVKPEIGEFYQGHYSGTMGVDVSEETPKLALDQTLSEIQIGQLLGDLINEGRLLGKGSVDTHIRTTGNQVAAFKQGLNGTLGFTFRDGAVKGFNLAKMIRTASSAYRGTGSSDSGDASPQQTDFSEMSATATIENGVLNNPDFIAKSPFLRVGGNGKVDLVQEQINYRVTATIVGTDKGQGGEERHRLTGVPIPVKLSGPLTQPNYSIDWGNILANEAKEELKEKAKEKAGEALQQFLGTQPGGASKGGGLLKGLF